MMWSTGSNLLVVLGVALLGVIGWWSLGAIVWLSVGAIVWLSWLMTLVLLFTASRAPMVFVTGVAVCPLVTMVLTSSRPLAGNRC